jgi:hypothetical protein
MRPLVAVATATLVLLAAGVAQAAPTKQQCIDADTEAQSQRSAGKFAAARALLRACIDPACPGAVRDDCTLRLDELERQQPTLVLNAKDARGADLSRVVVKLDGAVLTRTLDGRAIPVDPGEHVLTFEAEGVAPVERRLLIREGERSRAESVTFVGSGTPSPAQRTPAVAEPEPAVTDHGSGMRIGAYVLGGVGVVGIGVGSVLGLMASSSWSKAKDACPSADRCDVGGATSSKATALDLAAGSTVGFVAGGALLGGAALLYLLSPAPRTRAVGLVPGVGPGFASLVLRGEL